MLVLLLGLIAFGGGAERSAEQAIKAAISGDCGRAVATMDLARTQSDDLEGTTRARTGVALGDCLADHDEPVLRVARAFLEATRGEGSAVATATDRLARLQPLLLAEGHRLRLVGNVDAADAHVAAAHAIAPGFSTYVAQGMVDIARGEWAVATISLAAGLEMYGPGDPPGELAVACVQHTLAHERGHDDEATAAAARSDLVLVVAAMDGADPTALVLLTTARDSLALSEVTAMAQAGSLGLARIDAMIVADDDNAVLLMIRGDLQEDLGDVDGAEVTYLDALTRHADHRGLNYSLASLYLATANDRFGHAYGLKNAEGAKLSREGGALMKQARTYFTTALSSADSDEHRREALQGLLVVAVQFEDLERFGALKRQLSELE